MLGLHPLRLGHGWPSKNEPLPICYHVKFGRSVSKGLRINKLREPEKWAALGPRPRGWPQESTQIPHVCYIAERDRSALKGVGIRKLQNWGSLGLHPLWEGSVVIPSENTPLSKRVILPNLVVLQVKRCECNEGYPSKKLTHRVSP